MSVKKIYLFISLVTIFCFSLNVDNVYAETYNGDSGGGTGYNGGGGDCVPLGSYVVCGGGGNRIAVKITLQYYDQKTDTRTVVLGKMGNWPTYETHHTDYGDGWCPGNDYSGICYSGHREWFEKNGKTGFYSDEILKDILGERTVSTEKAREKLKYWLKRLHINIYDLNKESCLVDNNKSNCFGKSGYRIIIEPVIAGWAPRGERCNRSGDYCYFTVKEFAKRAGSVNKVNEYSQERLLKFARGLYTTFDDINIKKYNGSKDSLNKIWKCLIDEKCGIGYNIIDIGKALNQYTCEYYEKDKCKIKRVSDNTIVSTGKCNDFSENGYTDSKNKNHEVTCPKIEYGCEEETSTYGKCKIYTYVNGTKQSSPETVDCNEQGKPQGKTTYNGITLTKACPYKPKYNYDVDIACEDCEGTNTNGSYQIQDVADWEAILHSVKRNDNPTLQNYYTNNYHNGLLCRNSFNVVFPNQNTFNKIYTNAGRYLTVNAAGSLNNNGIYNIKTIRVERTVECISDKPELLSMDENQPLYLGTVDLEYDEDEKDNDKYDGVYTLHPMGKKTTVYPEPGKKPVLADVANRGNGAIERKNYYTVKKTTTANYYFKDQDLYKYVSPTGESLKSTEGKTDEDLKEYIKLNTANLPVSFTNKKGATITLYYKLPKDTGLSKIVESDNKDKIKFLEQKPTIDNIYKDNDLVKNSACAKLYPNNSEKYTSCVDERKRNNEDPAKCIEHFNKENNTYKCDIKPCKDGNCENDLKCSTPTTSNDGNYHDDDGTIITEDKWKEVCTCRQINGGYLKADGTKTTNNREYLESCPGPCKLNPGDEEECPNNASMGLSECYRCPETGLCPMPGNVCPGPGDVIYRTIDLKNPFPGQSAKTRKTGDNWCTIDENKVYHCEGKPNSQVGSNSLVYNQIINNRNTADYSVYNEKPLYKITLDSEAIEKIKDYNKTHNYDDWTGITYSDSVGSHSEFINKTWGTSRFEGVCKKDDNRNCEEDK